MKKIIFVALIALELGILAGWASDERVEVKQNVHYVDGNVPNGTAHKIGELVDGKLVWKWEYVTDNDWYGHDADNF